MFVPKYFFITISIFYCSKVSSFELCNFNDGLCEWIIEPPWNVVSLAILPRRQGILTNSPDVVTSEGPFLLAQGKFASVPSSRVISQKLSKSDHMRILAYRYQRRGKASLRILLKNETSEILLDSISPVELERTSWHRRSVIFPPIFAEDQTTVIFECDNIRTSEDVVALDEIDVTTPANVMWAGQDSRFFDEQDIKNREIRRSSSKLSKVCSPISCQFRGSLCSWKSSNFQILPSKIVNEASGESILTSSVVRLPIETSAFLTLKILESSESATSLAFRNIGTMMETTIWEGGVSGKTEKENSWKLEKIDLEKVPRGIPIILILKSITGKNDFVAISSMELTDSEGKILSCDEEASPVQPHSTNLIRLTALQNLKMSPIESLLFRPPISSTSFPFLPIPTSPSISFNFDENPRNPKIAVLPISPSQVSARGIPIVPISHFSNPLIPIPLTIPKSPFF